METRGNQMQRINRRQEYVYRIAAAAAALILLLTWLSA